ncbi:MAG: class I SAM-dependent methyltransferase [Fluviicola sp. XM-24bin1]|nr:MAG: class I SAM-dependent methyltransferase [Fluviicola sp. XM-24bin1]
MIKTLYRFVSGKFQNVFLDYKVDFKPRFGHGNGGAHPQLLDIVEAQRETYANHLESFLKYKEVYFDISKADQESDDTQPGWNNDFLPGLDIVAMYGLLRELNPKQYIEIGSGNSTKVARKAIKEGELDTKITSIDPYPRAQIDAMADKVIRKPIEEMEDYSDITNLEAGDILFIDNSHRCLPNSDVTVCFLELLPQLKKGVIVHVHDIYIPYDYPQFMCDRAYSEQYVLTAFLLANPKKYRPILPNYFISEDAELKKILAPVWEHENLQGVEQHGGSFWFEVTE